MPLSVPPADAPNFRLTTQQWERVVCDEAADLAALVRAVATTSRSGAASWYTRDVADGQRQLARAPYWLESGQVGIALCLAAHARALHLRGCDRAASESFAWARAATVALCDAAQTREAVQPSDPGLGIGWSGMAYALASVPRLTGDAGALDGARAALVRVERPRGGRSVDVFAAAAGAVLGSLAVHAVTGDPADLELARAWGDQVIARWTCVERAVSGFGHGTPDVAAALLRLAVRSGDERYAPRMVRIALRPSELDLDVINGWCRGTAGVGLALAAALSTELPANGDVTCWRDALGRVAADVVVEVAGARARGPYSLCCGTFGRVELLLDAADVLGDAQLRTAACRLAHAAVARAARRLAYHAVPYAEPLAPALFGGLAGVAYTLNTSLALIGALRCRGAEVYAATTSERRVAETRALGVTDVIVLRREAVRSPAGRLATAVAGTGLRFQAVLDPFFDLHAEDALEVLQPFGTYITCGFAGQRTRRVLPVSNPYRPAVSSGRRSSRTCRSSATASA